MKSEDATVAHVLQICKRTGKGKRFTLNEIISLFLSERPDMIASFPEAWGVLIGDKKIRMIKGQEPPLYEVAEVPEW